MSTLIDIGRFFLHMLLKGMMHKFGVLWVFLPLYYKLKVVPVNIYLLYHCPHFCFLNISYFVELDESMPDRLGILPQCKQHKKQLLVRCTFHFAHFIFISIWLLVFISICQYGASGRISTIDIHSPNFGNRLSHKVILLML